MDMQINGLINDIWEKLTPDGRNNVRDQDKPLKSVDLKEQSDPEAFTKHFLIEKILDLLNLEILPEKQFYIWGKRRSVDYILKNPKDAKFLMDAKPINADLFAKDESGAVNQIKGLFQHAKAKEEHDFGIATNGLKWVFINKEGDVTDILSVLKDFQQIKELVTGKQPIAKISEEEITEKFYNWYNALLHGGRYKDHNGNIKHISEKDSFVENIRSVERVEDREQIAQIIMDRLIFIKFLQSKGIIKTDVLRYISEYPEDTLVPKLRQLFFAVLNTEEEERLDLDKQFEGIPYLNGSLFNLTEIERKNTEFRIKAEILKDAINFLDSFKFVHREKEDADSINPEILGYIFERAMTALDRKGTGSYYTPKVITRYIAENTIYPSIIEKVNKLLKEEKGYRDTELIKTIEELFILPATTLNAIWNKIVLNLKVLDNACGSGAFLLQAANILFDLNRRIDDKLSIGNSDVALKKLILIKNIYGVDINPNAIEIAKLRLWLWLADSYDADHIEALPNIDYNLRVGNSLVGYLDLSKFKTYKVSLMDYLSTEKPLFELLSERMDLLGKYKYSYGKESKDLRDRLMEKDEKIRRVLNINLYREFTEKKIQITEEEFEGLNSFHWGFEFYDVFDTEKTEEERGFDVVIGNPPYVRADTTNVFIVKERELIKKIDLYRTLYEKWDLFIPFIERSLKLLGRNCMFSYIISNSFNTSKFADKSKEFILDNYYLKQIDFFKDIEVFKGVGVESVILTVKKSKERKKTIRILHTDSFENAEELEASDDTSRIFKTTPELDFGGAFKDTELLGDICFISKGMVIHAEERRYNGEFKKDDLISDVPTKINTKPYVEAKYISRYRINKIKYLEWDTERSPKKLSRPTFPELFIHPKIIRGATVDGTYDESGLVCNHSINVMVRYDDLKSVSNRSIENSIKKWTDKTRKELGEISLNFDLKYILTILNSKFAKFYLNTIRRHRIEYYFYPDDFKRLPIKKLSSHNQQPFIHLCNYRLFLNATEERRESEKELIEFIDKEIIESLVYELYFKEKLGMNLLKLVEPYLGDIEGIGDDEAKSRMIEEVVEKIKTNGMVMMEIERMKGHEWVKVIEGENEQS